MERVVLDGETRSRLKQRAELVDERGRLVGLFVPAIEYYREQVERANGIFDRETLENARKDVAENGVVTTADMLAAVAQARADYEGRH